MIIMGHGKIDNILLKTIWHLSQRDLDYLFSYTSDMPLHKALFNNNNDSKETFDQRLRAWSIFLSNISEVNSDLLRKCRPSVIWSYSLVLAHFIKKLSGQIFSISGAPGVGKTTLTYLINLCIFSFDSKLKILQISLEDFYFSKKERERRKIKWRAQPGSHDIDKAVHIMKQVKDFEDKILVPRFDFVSDDSGEPEEVRGPISLILFEGWFIGKNDCGYEKINEYIDYRIYLDCPIETVRRRRFARERELYRRHKCAGGLSAKEMRIFWRDVLGPGIDKWVLPIRSNADLIIKLGAKDWEILGAHKRR